MIWQVEKSPKQKVKGKQPFSEAGEPDTGQVTPRTQFSVALSSGLLTLPRCLDKGLPITWADPVPTGIQTPVPCPEPTPPASTVALGLLPPLAAFPLTCKSFT